MRFFFFLASCFASATGQGAPSLYSVVFYPDSTETVAQQSVHTVGEMRHFTERRTPDEMKNVTAFYLTKTAAWPQRKLLEISEPVHQTIFSTTRKNSTESVIVEELAEGTKIVHELRVYIPE